MPLANRTLGCGSEVRRNYGAGCMNEYIWTEVWLVDADIPSYLMQILARADGTYELHDPQKQAIVRRSSEYAELADELNADEYERLYGPRVYDPDHDPCVREGAPGPVGAKVRGMSVLNVTKGAVDLELVANLSEDHVPLTAGRMLFSMSPNEAIDIGHALIRQAEMVRRRDG